MCSAALLASCGIYTKYEPQTSIPQNICGDSIAVITDSATLIDWRDLFTDPQLQGLINRGLAQNTDLLSAEQRIKESEATLLSARLAFLPSFALAPQGGVSSFDKSKGAWTYSLPATASWELDIFGRMRNAKQQAKALLAQSHDYKQAVRTQLIASIANTYYTLQMLDDQLSISQQTEQAWQETVTTTKALMQAGQSNEAAVSQMEAQLETVRTSILDLKEQINQTENSLSLLLASPPALSQGEGAGYAKTTVLPSEDAIQPSKDAALSSLPLGEGRGGALGSASPAFPLSFLRNRPDIRSAERQMEAAFYGVNQARSAFYPQVTLSGSAGWTNTNGVAIVNPAKFLAQAVGSLTFPLFNRGHNIANLKIAKAQQEEAKLSFQQALLNAGSEVNDALTAYQTATAKSAHYDRQVASLENALRSTKLLMQHGNTTYLEVLTAQQTLLTAQLQQTANRFACVQSLITLYHALGGGQE